jgi:hypothetical protein
LTALKEAAFFNVARRIQRKTAERFSGRSAVFIEAAARLTV